MLLTVNNIDNIIPGRAEHRHHELGKGLTYRKLSSELKQLEDGCRAYFLGKLSDYPEELMQRYHLDLAFWGVPCCGKGALYLGSFPTWT